MTTQNAPQASVKAATQFLQQDRGATAQFGIACPLPETEQALEAHGLPLMRYRYEQLFARVRGLPEPVPELPSRLR